MQYLIPSLRIYLARRVCPRFVEKIPYFVIKSPYLLTGFNSEVLRLPWDDVGFAVLTNDNELGFTISQIVKYRLLDEVLALEPIDWRAKSVVPAPLADHS
jgi:hypothetical protein